MFKLKQLLLLALVFGLGNVSAEVESARIVAALLGNIQLAAGVAPMIAGAVKLAKARSSEALFYSDYDEKGNFIKGLKRPLVKPEEIEAAQKAAQRKALQILLHGVMTGCPGLITFGASHADLGIGSLLNGLLCGGAYAALGVSFLAHLLLAHKTASNLIEHKGRLYSKKDHYGNKLPRGHKRLITDAAEYKSAMSNRLKHLKNLALTQKLMWNLFGASFFQFVVTAACGALTEDLTLWKLLQSLQQKQGGGGVSQEENFG